MKNESPHATDNCAEEDFRESSILEDDDDLFDDPPPPPPPPPPQPQFLDLTGCRDNNNNAGYGTPHTCTYTSASVPPVETGYSPINISGGNGDDDDDGGVCPSPSPSPFGGRTEEELVQVTAIPSCEYVLKGVANTVHVLINIKTAPKPPSRERPPCDLAILLDRSVSMKGEKLEKCKLAVNHVIDQLEVDDVLHLIAYAKSAEIIFENGDLSEPDDLKELIANLNPVYYTNIHEGLSLGADVLRRNRREGQTRIQRIFLFSDGLATAGKRKSEQIKELVREIKRDRICITSFGIGSDFDEELMKDIAELGSGDYFFIEDAACIPRHVDKGLRGVLCAVGSDPVLKLRGTNGAIVRKIYSRGADELARGVHLGDLKQDNLVQVLSVVEVSPADGDGADILTWSLQYVPDGQNADVSLKGNLNLKYTDNDQEVCKMNPAVTVAKTVQEIGETDAGILSLLDHGQLETVIQMKEQNLERLHKIEYLDGHGFVTALIKRTERAIAKIRDQNASAASRRKDLHYLGYAYKSGNGYVVTDD